MPRWAMVIDLDKCVACQACSIACRMENNTPTSPPDQAEMGRTFRWNDVYPLESESEGEYPHVKVFYLTIPCQHCDNPPCVKVCPVQATYQGEDGIVHQNYARCIGCRLCTVACPYTVRQFNWFRPHWVPPLEQHLSPDRVESRGHLEGPAVREKGIVEKCTFCIHRLKKAQEKAAAENRPFRSDEYVPACVQTCIGRARFFGDLEDPHSTVSILAATQRAFRLQEELGTHPKVVYLRGG